ncbi:hypothetical protein B0T26DRAFT_434769 [Lasiosphaeria miniovina]|uniref:Uncharacterized protein n=1 Tax=Lasiosphaeria miniovina TaxID=1954250 RepID=A0AA40DNJ3_9PEZI|nr:uncharacterized protein B0T26DRAFT_434769 [Lasiosphaeria miniovina]KAK0710269.1 hypothetical protein B0T26DRAFT_434769 [Lasiosphaeria miniovina]
MARPNNRRTLSADKISVSNQDICLQLSVEDAQRVAELRQQISLLESDENKYDFCERIRDELLEQSNNLELLLAAYDDIMSNSCAKYKELKKNKVASRFATLVSRFANLLSIASNVRARSSILIAVFRSRSLELRAVVAGAEEIPVLGRGEAALYCESCQVISSLINRQLHSWCLYILQNGIFHHPASSTHKGTTTRRDDGLT